MQDSTSWEKVRDPFKPKGLAFQYDPLRKVIQWGDSRQTTEIDLNEVERRFRRRVGMEPAST